MEELLEDVSAVDVVVVVVCVNRVFLLIFILLLL